MRVLDWRTCQPPRAGPRAVAVGSFDGLHLGHRQVLDCLMEQARDLGLPTCLVSFEPTPAQVFAAGPPHNLRLTTQRERRYLLEVLGLDELCLLPFDRPEVRQKTALQFLREVVIESLGARLLVGSTSHSMGSDRQSWPQIAALAREEGLRVCVVEPLEVDGQPVSSTRVRELVWQGEVEAAGRLLGRDYSLDGQVRHGTGTGRLLGFPTLNVFAEPEKLLPAGGVYAGWVGGKAFGEGPVQTPYHGAVWPAAINVGIAPTRRRILGEPGPTGPIIEAHVLEWQGDVVDGQVTLGFVRRLRAEQSFADLEELRLAIVRDVERTRELLLARPDRER